MGPTTSYSCLWVSIPVKHAVNIAVRTGNRSLSLSSFSLFLFSPISERKWKENRQRVKLLLVGIWFVYGIRCLEHLLERGRPVRVRFRFFLKLRRRRRRSITTNATKIEMTGRNICTYLRNRLASSDPEIELTDSGATVAISFGFVFHHHDCKLYQLKFHCRTNQYQCVQSRNPRILMNRGRK